jgi:hypothetical protein
MSGWPASTIELSYAASRRWLALIGALFFLGIAVAAVIDTTSDRILIPMGLVLGIGCLWAAVTSGGSATADANGIVYVDRKGATQQIAWRDLEAVSVRPNQMVLRSARGEEITIAAGLRNYVPLLDAVVAMDRPRAAGRTVFTSNRSRITTVVVGLVFIAIAVGTGATDGTAASVSGVLWVLGVGSLIIALFQPSRQELTDDAIVVRSLLTKKRYDRDAIAGVGFIQPRGRYGPSFPRLALTLVNGRRITLDCREMLEVYDAIVRWREAQPATP